MTTLNKAQRKELMEKLLAKTDLAPQIKAEMQRLGALARQKLEAKYRTAWGTEVFDTIHALPEEAKAKVMKTEAGGRVYLYPCRGRPIARAISSLSNDDALTLRLGFWGSDRLDFPFPSALWSPCWDHTNLSNTDFTDDDFAPLVALLNEYITVRDTVAQALAGIRTHKQLAEKMPEVAALLPTAAKTYELADTSIINNATALLMKHGAFKEKNDADE